MAQWQDKTTVKKGNVGEAIVKSLLEAKNLVIYKPVTDSPHAFDNLVMKDKETFFIVDVKTKPARLYYPDTGINLKHYNEYKKISDKHKLLVFIFFVDENAGKIYGNYLHILEKKRLIRHNGLMRSYPLIQNSIIYFPLEIMQTFSELNQNQIAEIKNLTTSNYMK